MDVFTFEQKRALAHARTMMQVAIERATAANADPEKILDALGEVHAAWLVFVITLPAETGIDVQSRGMRILCDQTGMAMEILGSDAMIAAIQEQARAAVAFDAQRREVENWPDQIGANEK